jgi:hypothetical protein
MSLRAARTFTATYLVLMAIAVTWPGMVPFARIRPMVLGLPFGLFWVAAWIGMAVVVLYLLDLVERRHRDEEDS